MPTTTKSHSTVLPAVVLTRETAPSPSNACDAVAEQQFDAMLCVHVAVERADLVAEQPRRGQLERIDQRDIQPFLPRRCGELAADPAAADDDHTTARVQARFQRLAVVERAQVVDAVEIGARDRDLPGLCAGRQQQAVVVQLAPIVKRDRRRAGVDARSGDARQQFDVVLVVEALGVHVGLVAL